MPSTENNYQDTDLGNITFNPRGEYDSEASYEYLDTVSYQGGTYMCCVKYPNTITGIEPEKGKNSECWQIVAAPGGLTSDYVAMHDDVVNKAKQIETSRAAVELSQQEVEAAQADVRQMRQDTQEAAEEAASSRDSAAGYAQSAETSRTAAKESEDNINAQVAEFDTHVAEKTSAAETAITEARRAAVNAVSTKQDDATQAVTDEGDKQIKNVEDAGTEQVGKVESARASAVSAAGAAGVSAVNAVKAQQTASIKAVADEGTQQVSAIKEAGENAFQNISNGVDKGLSEEGKAADAKATGEAISKLTEDTAVLQKRQNVLVGSETGNPVSCDDAFAAPLCGLTVYGKSTQDGTPSPDAPVPIVSAGDGGSVAVKVTGKNWMPPNLRTGNFVECSVKKNTQITVVFKGDIVSQGGNILFVGENNEQMWVGIDKGSVRKDIVLKANATKFQYLLEDMASENVCMTWNASSPDYEPYREQLLTLPTPNGLPGIPVASGGNYTDPQGQQWVCDEVNLKRGVKVQMVNAVDLSTCTITGTTNLTATKRLSIRLPLKGKDYAAKALCNRLPYLVSFTSDTIHFYIDTNNAQVFIPIGAKNPEEGEYILFYILATPIETPLTPAEIAAYKALTAYDPDMVVQTGDGAGVRLDYQRDVNIAIKRIEDAVASMT